MKLFRVKPVFKEMRLFLLLAMMSMGAAMAAPGPRASALVARDAQGLVCQIPAPQARATVLVFIAHDCPIANGYAPEIQRLAAVFAPSGVVFDLVYVEPGLSLAGVRAHEAAYGYHLAAIRDIRHRLVQAMGATVTPEAVVLLPSGKVAYRGRIDNKYPALGQQRTVVTQHDLRDALAAIVAGRPAPHPSETAIGCFVPPLN